MSRFDQVLENRKKNRPPGTTASAPRGPGRPKGKASDKENYRQVTAYIRRQTYTDARKQLLDGGSDFSELVERLVSNWLSAPAPGIGDKSTSDFYGRLRSEITRRRKEAQYRRSRVHNRWSPDQVITTVLCELIDWIEDELDKINPGQSANGHQAAATSTPKAHG